MKLINIINIIKHTKKNPFILFYLLMSICILHLSPMDTMGKNTYFLSTIEYPSLFQKEKTKGKGYGMARDLTTEAFIASGSDVRYQILPMARCIKMYKKYAANVGAIDWFKNAQMMNKVLYANVAHSKFVLFYKKKKFPGGIHFSKLEDLKKYGRIGNVRGSSTTKIVQKAGLKIDWADSLKCNFKKLNGNRFDIAISIQIAGWNTLEHLYPDRIDEFDCCQKTIFEIPISVTFRKKNKAIYDEFMDGLKTIANNGKYREVLERYYENKKIPDKIVALLNQYKSFDKLSAR